MVGHGGSSAGSYLADPTSPIPSHCASIVVTSTVRVNYVSLYRQTSVNVHLHATGRSSINGNSNSLDNDIPQTRRKPHKMCIYAKCIVLYLAGKSWLNINVILLSEENTKSRNTCDCIEVISDIHLAGTITQDKYNYVTEYEVDVIPAFPREHR